MSQALMAYVGFFNVVPIGSHRKLQWFVLSAPTLACDCFKVAAAIIIIIIIIS